MARPPMHGLLRRLILDIAYRLRWRGPLLVLSMTANGLMEGVGLVPLLPLLTGLAGGNPVASGMLGRISAAILGAVGMPADFRHLLVLALCAFLIQTATSITEGWLSAKYRSRYIASWRTELFEAVMRARWTFFTARKAGQLTHALLEETQRIGSAFYLIALSVSGSIFILVYLGIALLAAWQIAFGATIFGVLMAVLIQPLTRYSQRAGAELSGRTETLHVMASEFVAGAKLIKATASEDNAIRLFADTILRTLRLQQIAFFQPFLVRSIYEISAVFALGISFWIGIAAFQLSPSSILMTVYLFIRVYLRLSQLQQSVQTLHSTYAPAIVLAGDTLQQARAASEPRGGKRLPVFAGDRGVRIALADVTVRYDGAPALAGVTLDVAPGAVVGICGPSGAGKSTLVDAILGLVQPDEGRIEIDGQDLAGLAHDAWRHAIGYVAQDTFLFNATIRDNIRWSNQGASDVDIERAARQAHAEDFIRALPQGFETEVGDRGIRLSGGQRQRIGLARALIGQSRLLVLDEATSALDSESERSVMQAIAELRDKITIIIVAHRLSTLRDAGVICFLEEGRIAELGRWQDLNQPGTRFHGVWALQSTERASIPST
jgi:ATP-binding cassette, subfamily C, bacterial